MAEVSKQPESVPGQPSVERPADSPNAEPHPVDDLRQARRPTVEELLKQGAGSQKLEVGGAASGKTSAVEIPQTPGVTEGTETVGPVEELLKIDEAKTFGFTDAAALAARLSELRKSSLEINN